jgi:hypothetical protein
MLKVAVVLFVIAIVLWILSHPQTYFRKESPTTRLYSEGTREVLRSAATLSAPADPSQDILRGHDQGYDRFHVR